MSVDNNNSPAPEVILPDSEVTRLEGSRWEPSASSPAAPKNYHIGGNAEEQHRELMRQAVQDGHVTIEQANAELAKENLPPLPTQSKGPISHAESFDRSFSPPPSPESYTDIPSLRPFGQATTVETESTDTAFRKAVHAGAFNNEIAKSLAESVRQSNEKISRMKTRDEFQAWSNSERKSLMAVWQDRTDENLKTVQKFISEEIEPKAPGTLRMLANSPASQSAVFLKMLYDHATRINTRREGKW